MSERCTNFHVWIFLLFFISSFSSFSQILTFEFSALTGDEVSASSNFNHSNLNSSTISRGVGLTAPANGGRFNASNWALTSIENAVSGDQYMEFTITPNSGYQFSVSSIQINLQRSSTGPSAIALRSSADGYTSNLDQVYPISDLTSTQVFTFTFTQSSSSSAVTYRFYMYAEASAGTGGIGDGSGDDLIVNGSVVANNSASSDIISASNETANINYISKTAAAINSTSDALRVWSFTIRDGSGAADADAVGTILTGLTINKGASNGVTGWANTIKQAALYDGTSEVAEVSVTGETIVFSSISVTVADNSNKTLDLYLTFETSSISDNQQFQFRIQEGNVSEDASIGSVFASFSDIASSTSGDNNRIEVTASKLNFVQQPSHTVVNLIMSPSVTVEAADANDNRDLDFSGNIRITSTGTLSSTPVDIAAVSGIATFNTLTHTAIATNLTLNAERTSTLDWDITSNTFNISLAAVGDFRTAGSGNWGANTTWEKWDGSAWVACGAGEFPDASTVDVTIKNGHIIDNDGSGTPPWDVKNLTVETGGKLWDNSFEGANSYIQVYGNIVCDGTIGNISGDDISFDIAGGTNCTISGTGTFAATRIRKDAGINTASDASLIIDMDITLLWNSSSGTVIYNDATPSNFNVTVNAGKTLRATAPGSNVGNISIDGVNFSGPDPAHSGGTFTVYGTIDTDGILYAYTDNTVAGRSCNYIIENGGTIKCRYVHTGASGAAGQLLRVKSGGTLNIYSVKDSVGSADCSTWYNYSTTNNTFDFQTGSTVIYSCSNVQQNLNGPSTYSNITVTGGGIKNLTQDLVIDQSLTLTSGIVSTNAYKVVMNSTSPGSLVHTSGSSSFINGNFRRYIATNTGTYEFPVGNSNSSTGYFRADLINNNLTGISYIDASTAAIINEGNNVDERLNIEQDGTAIEDIAEQAEWSLIPDAAATGGSYGVKLYIANISGLSDDQFCIVKRPDASTDYADWGTDEGTTTIPANGLDGRTVSSGYAQRTGYASFSKFAIGKASAVLPIELLTFDAEYLNGKAELSWKTAVEINNHYFSVERSYNGKEFINTGTVKGAGNSNVVNYYLFSDEPESKSRIIYYRLKQVDFDGKFSFSKIIALATGNSKDSGYLITDPERKTVTYYSVEKGEEEYLVSVMDINGKTLIKTDFKNKENISFDCSNFPPGIYFFRLDGDAATVVEKFILF